MIDSIDYHSSATIGVVCTLVLLWSLPGIPAVAFGCGMSAVIVPMLLQRSERKRYALAGTIYLLATGAVFVVGDAIVGPLSHAESIVPATMAFGSGSLLVLAVRLAGRRVARRTVGTLLGEETAARIFDALAAAVATLGLIWLLLTVGQKVTTHGSSTLGGLTLFALNVAGVELLVGIPLLGEVDIVLVLFIGCVLAAFYTVETLHTTWVATKKTGKTGVQAGGRVRTLAGNVVSGRRDGGDSEQ